MFCSFRTPSGHPRDHISMEIIFCKLGPLGVLFAIFDTQTTPHGDPNHPPRTPMPPNARSPQGHQNHPQTTPKSTPKGPHFNRK